VLPARTRLSDPHKLLKGSGNQVRNIRLDSIGILDQPAVQALIAEAVALAVRPAHGTPRRRMISGRSRKGSGRDDQLDWSQHRPPPQTCARNMPSATQSGVVHVTAADPLVPRPFS